MYNRNKLWSLSSSPSGPNRGHYITIVKSYGYWLLFDDDIVEVCHLDLWAVTLLHHYSVLLNSLQEIEPHAIEGFFGLTDAQRSGPNESGYILFYQSRDTEK